MKEEKNMINPLVEEWDGIYGCVPFDRISTSDYEEAIYEGIRIHDKEIEDIVNNPDTPSFENTVAPLDRAGKALDRALYTLGNLEAALGDEALMEISINTTPAVARHSTSILLNKKLYERIKYVYDRRNERMDISPEAMRLIEETHRSFADNGADLEGEARKEYENLMSSLSELSVKFSQNVTNDMKNPQRRMWITEVDTAGLPQSIKNAAREAAKEALEAEGKIDDGSLYLITMFTPSYVPFMKYADSRELREKLYRMNGERNTSGEYDNSIILKEIADKRLQLAQLMGKETFAQHRLLASMARTPETVMQLLDNLKENYRAPMKKELEELNAFAKSRKGEDFEIMPWDYSYWFEKLRNERYAFSDEDLKPYFELNNTIAGIFGLATKLYGYSFKRNEEIPVYHPDVRAYEVIEDGKVIGLLYADFFYRSGKGPGAWMTEFRPETKNDSGKRDLPLISIVMNFSKPVGNNPVLLTPGEVNTFLHEFGHALHGLSSQAVFASLSGTNVYRDFVELFSQFNENYLTEKEFLDDFARNYLTGEKIPEELLDKFIKSRQFGAAYACMRQLGFGYLDMAYHTRRLPFKADESVASFEAEAQKEVKCFEPVKGCVVSTSFGHIFSGGYAAGYYGYKWSEVLDADAFAAFKENGIFDKATAQRFKKMLQSGGTIDPMKLYVDFRGRNPSIDALLERDGIKVPSNKN